jgi:beta-lactamase regulating signal transducer with metallopeptidase domain
MLWWVAETTVVATALAAVAALVPRLRRLGPAARHALWLVVLIRLVTPPLLSWPWPVPVPPAPEPAPRAGTVALAARGDDLDRQGTEPAAADVSGTAGGDRPGGGSPDPPRGARFDRSAIGRLVLAGWLAVSAALAAVQVVRILGFRRRLRGAVPAPAWLVTEAERLGERLGVSVPEALAVPGLGTPLLWCLGRPRLLLPTWLIGTLDVEGWRAILAHELAHLRRRDPWVRRLALVAGWVWWWNPLYWIARRRLDAEAELACDAWVVSILPDDRIVYAEVLLGISASLSTSMPPAPVPAPAPALGVTSSGRLFERRLTMILRDQVPCRLTLPGLLGAGLLGLLALPSWTVAQAPVDTDRDLPAPAADRGGLFGYKTTTGEPEAGVADDDDDDDDEDDDRAKPAKPAKPAEKARPAKRAAKARKAAKKKTAPRPDKDGDGADRSAPSRESLRLDPEVAEQLETLAEKLEKSMEEKFGPGSEFEAKMKEFGKRMEEKFGPGSEFEAKMKQLGERMEKEFGPGSDFAKRMKESLTRDEDKDKEKGEDRPGRIAKGKSTSRATTRPTRRAAARTGRSSRAQRIRELELKIDELKDELKKLKEEDSDGDDDDSDASPGRR